MQSGKIDRARLVFALILLISILLAVFFFARKCDAAEVFSADGPFTLVIDAGHGGLDSGALAADGTKESDINLAIALKMDALAQLFGVNTALTRTDDSWRTDYASYSEHEDLVYRTDVANRAINGIMFSIHQNCYITPQPCGAQVLYSPMQESEILGKLTQANLVRFTDPENRRVAEPAPKPLYITANTQCPTVLVECGFMSNPDDVNALKSPEHQSAVAAVLFASYTQFSSQLLIR